MNTLLSNPARHVSNPPSVRPLMIYDGDCNFCMFWIARWRKATGDRVDYLSSQQVGDRFPEIPPQAYAGSVQWIEPDGRVLEGADAVFRLFDFAPGKYPLLQSARRMPGFMALARLAYRVVARHRAVFSWITRMLDRAGWR